MKKVANVKLEFAGTVFSVTSIQSALYDFLEDRGLVLLDDQWKISNLPKKYVKAEYRERPDLDQFSAEGVLTPAAVSRLKADYSGWKSTKVTVLLGWLAIDDMT